MIKLIDFSFPEADIATGEGMAIYVNKHIIKRIQQGYVKIVGMKEKYPVSYLYDINDNMICYVKETPEEILAMPDIETTEKVIDWEHRKYDIAKMIFPLIYQYGERTDAFEYARETMLFTEALINELKKGEING